MIRMFNRLFKPKFYSKCERSVKRIKTRIDIIRKKRNSVQKFLKHDIAELLRIGLDTNAYGRAAGLILEQNRSSCYDLLEKFNECISNHLQELSKQRDCPDECKEAVSSLIYAAARFADLPELRQLRTLFTKKFGSSLEPYISKEFVEKLRRDPPTREMKIQLLHSIAQEFSVDWDSKLLEQRLSRPSLSREERPKHDSDEKKVQKNHDGAIHTTDKLLLGSSSDDETSTDMSSQDGTKTCSSFGDSVSEDEVESKRPFSYGLVPPPYLKSKADQDKSSSSKKTEDSSGLAEMGTSGYLLPEKPTPRSVRRRPLKPPPSHDIVPPSKLPDYDDLAARISSLRGT